MSCREHVDAVLAAIARVQPELDAFTALALRMPSGRPTPSIAGRIHGGCAA
jgi:hypothetical protein